MVLPYYADLEIQITTYRLPFGRASRRKLVLIQPQARVMLAPF